MALMKRWHPSGYGWIRVIGGQGYGTFERKPWGKDGEKKSGEAPVKSVVGQKRYVMDTGERACSVLGAMHGIRDEVGEGKLVVFLTSFSTFSLLRASLHTLKFMLTESYGHETR